MKQELKSLAKQILGRQPALRSSPNLLADKKELILYAYDRLKMNSFADLGGVWNVDGGYAFYAMEQNHVTSGVLVDTDMTPAVLEQQKSHPTLKLIKGNFGDPAILKQIGNVDAVFFFDTLLHQVNPNWQDVLKMYAGTVKIVLIYNQQFVNLPKTTRLLDLGIDEYSRNVPHALNEEPYSSYFRDLDAIHPQHKRPYRDIHNIWQWGIVDADLIGFMNSLGFTMQYYKNCGQFGELQNVENHSFAFSRSPASCHSRS